MPLLIHEATFLRAAELDPEDYYRHGKHTALDSLLKAALGWKVGHLLLTHFSIRYTPAEIDSAIAEFCGAYAVPFPVSRILPGTPAVPDAAAAGLVWTGTGAAS